MNFLCHHSIVAISQWLPRFTATGLGIGFAIVILAMPGFAQDAAPPNADLSFRLESKLFAEAEQPVSQNLTVFIDNLVFDFQIDPQTGKLGDEIVVFEPLNQQLTLLDQRRQVKLELHDLRLLKILDGIRRESENDRRTRFLVQDQFEEQIDADQKQVTLTSNYITYRFQGDVPQDDRVTPIYLEFLDYFTRLQASDPKKLPPFPRIRLNQSIRRVGWIPNRVEIEVKQNDLFKVPFSAHTEHKLEMGVTPRQRKWVESARKQWLAYRAVSLAEYRGLTQSAGIENPLKKIRR